jgi:diguanylate cyclase (GGDEF)-like protein/PAS domain S-box-containing protein
VKQDDIIRLIVIEESANDAEVILNSLRKARYPIRPRHVEDDEDLQEALTEQEWDLIITVPQVGDFTVGQICEMVNSAKQDIPVIVLVSKLEGKIMAELLKAGARTVIPSGNDGCLQIIVGRELESLAIRRHRKHLEQLYKESQKHNKMLLETSQDAIAYVHDGMHIYANPSYLKLFSYNSMEDLEGMPIMDLITLEDRAKFRDFMREFIADQKDEERQIELEGLKATNKRFDLTMEIGHAIYDSERCLQVIMRDRSQSQDLELKLKELSRKDQLTGLFNRLYFMELLEKALAKAMETHTRSVLFYITLDNFDSIKQTVGVGGIDPVILNVSKVLKNHCEGGTLARFGEEIFTLLITDKDKEYASELAERLCKAVEATVTEVGAKSVIATCSIGITVVFASATNPQDVLNDAHTACEIAASRSGNTFEVYKAVVKSGEPGKLKTSDIAKMVETAIEEHRLSLRFQPIVSLRGESQEIYEVFLRMVDAEGNQVPTGDLFDAADKANLIVKLDKWVLKEAVRVLADQQKQGHKTHFFIKLSDQSVKDADVLLTLKKLLKASQVPGERIIIELSESTAITQIKLAQAFIKQLQANECKSALEHFGTGLNSDTTLKHLPVHYVKIDSSFSKGLSSNVENQQAVQKIIKLAHELGKQTIAEAVEDANSLAVLWTSELDLAQGHYIQAPLEAPEFDFAEE